MSANATKSVGSRAGRSHPTPLRANAKSAVRRALATGLHGTGLLRFAERLAATNDLRWEPSSRLPKLRTSSHAKFGILCYHRVGTEGVPLFSRLQPRVFEAQMRYVRKHYRVVSMEQLCREMQDEAEVPPTLAVTFDDGYRDLYNLALPVLRDYQIPATIYLVGRCMETGEALWYDRVFAALQAVHGPEFEAVLGSERFRYTLHSFSDRIQAAWKIICYLRSVPDQQRRMLCAEFELQAPISARQLEARMLTWDQVRTMHRAGISFGAHTMSHPAVSQLHPSSFHNEFVRSRELLEAGLGAPLPDFAYPFGKPADCSLAAEEFLGRSGYRSCVTTSDGYNTSRSNPRRLRRRQVGEDGSIAEFAFDLCRMFLEGSTEAPDAVSGDEYADLLGAAGAKTAAN